MILLDASSSSLVFTRPVGPGAGTYPPDMVFANPELDFLLTIGGHLVEDEAQYQRLMGVLDEMGETYFHLVENPGATVVPGAHCRPPFRTHVAVTSTFAQFQEVVARFAPPFGFFTTHFYVFGRLPTWGLYLCEHPTLLFIGCVPAWRERFAQTYGIAGNGYPALESFIAQEYQWHPAMHAQLVRTYGFA